MRGRANGVPDGFGDLWNKRRGRFLSILRNCGTGAATADRVPDEMTRASGRTGDRVELDAPHVKRACRVLLERSGAGIGLVAAHVRGHRIDARSRHEGDANPTRDVVDASDGIEQRTGRPHGRGKAATFGRLEPLERLGRLLVLAGVRPVLVGLPENP